MVLSLETVERVRKVSPEARSRNTTAAYSGWMSVFMSGFLGTCAVGAARSERAKGFETRPPSLAEPGAAEHVRRRER
ncbi:hypothetical protein GCM10009766_01640 [Microcella frigidaquae]